MEQTWSKMRLVLVFIAAAWACFSAQPICQPPIISLQSCIAYFTSNASGPPTPQCCIQLTNLVQTQAQCLCTFLNVVPNFPLNINRTQAITLPGACNIQAPPLSQCNAPAGTLTPTAPAAGSPQAAPGPASPSDSSTPLAPGGVSPPSPSTATGVPAGKGGSKAGPNKPQSSSATSSTTFAPLLVFLLAASLFSSF